MEPKKTMFFLLKSNGHGWMEKTGRILYHPSKVGCKVETKFGCYFFNLKGTCGRGRKHWQDLFVLSQQVPVVTFFFRVWFVLLLKNKHGVNLFETCESDIHRNHCGERIPREGLRNHLGKK